MFSSGFASLYYVLFHFLYFHKLYKSNLVESELSIEFSVSPSTDSFPFMFTHLDILIYKIAIC